MARHSESRSASPRPASMQASPSIATDDDSASFPSFPSGRWRVVSAWTSLRRHLDSPRSSKTPSPNTSSTFTSGAALGRPSKTGGPTSGGKSTQSSSCAIPAQMPSSELQTALTKRKRVSLFLKRRRSAQPFYRGDANDTCYAQDARSIVSSAAGLDKSGRTHRELDDAFLRKLKRRVRSAVVDANMDTHLGRADTGGSSVGANEKHCTAAFDKGKGTDPQTTGRSSHIDNCDGLAAIRVMAAAADADMRRSNRSSLGISSDGVGADAVSVTLLRGTDLKQDEGGEDGGDDEIVGAICLEDFADGEPDGDYAFLDGLSVEMSTDHDAQGGDSAMNGSFSQEGSRREVLLDTSAVRWITDEREFANFFAQVGVNIDDLFDADEQQQLSEFCVDDHVIDEWRAAGEEHNLRCLKWSFSNLCIKNNSKHDDKPGSVGGSVSPMDIRQLAAEFRPRDEEEQRV